MNPRKEELVADGQNDGANKEADNTHRDESANRTQKDHSSRNGYAASQQEGLEHVVNKAHEDAPKQKQDCLCCARDGKHLQPVQRPDQQRA